MRYFIALSLALACMAATASTLHAQSVAFDAGYPKSPQAGQITVNGTYSVVANKQTAQNVKIYATQATGAKGGPGGQQNTTRGATTFAGTITGLPTGTYQVYARMQYTQAGQTKFWDSVLVTNIKVN